MQKTTENMYEANISFECPGCTDVVELFGINMIMLNTMIDSLATGGDYSLFEGMSNRCKLEALKFALLAYLDQDLTPTTIEPIIIKEITDGHHRTPGLPRSS